MIELDNVMICGHGIERIHVPKNRGKKRNSPGQSEQNFKSEDPEPRKEARAWHIPSVPLGAARDLLVRTMITPWD